MAFFPQALCNQDRNLTPLFRLLDDFDSYSQGNAKTSTHRERPSSLPHWQPSFDVCETSEAYELHGELPGVSKEHVNIDFTEPQTLHIRGRSERRYIPSTSSNAAGQIEDTGAAATHDSEKNSKNSRRARVEDEDDEEWSNAGQTTPGTPSSTVVEVERPAQVRKPADNAKYWLAERKVGEFSRSFNFPDRVDQDGVRASFQNGILSIIVPKAKKHESRRILIS
ncbi:hypothetical protein E4U41_005162 [Claviceps citrina]|nr:hypothetical protein E4U41_005162 [Claviceps citrina]